MLFFSKGILKLEKLYWIFTKFILILPNSRSCIGFLGNRSGGLRTGDRARPRVADRGALYRGLLLNTDTKLNKQSRTMFQGWCRSNSSQAKVLTTVPRAAWLHLLRCLQESRSPPRVLRPHPCMRGSAGLDRILP